MTMTEKLTSLNKIIFDLRPKKLGLLFSLNLMVIGFPPYMGIKILEAYIRAIPSTLIVQIKSSILTVLLV